MAGTMRAEMMVQPVDKAFTATVLPKSADYFFCFALKH